MINTHKTLLKRFDNEIARVSLEYNTLKRYEGMHPDVDNAIDICMVDLSTCCDKNIYIVQTAPLVNEYAALLRRIATKDIIARKRAIVRQFNNIVTRILHKRKWDAIDNKNYDRSSSTTLFCTACGSTWLETIDDGHRACVDCAADIPTFEVGTTQLDYSRATVVGKFVYNRVLHFQDCIRQFQGKQNCKIPQNVYDELDKKFHQYRLLIDSDNPIVKYSRITKQHIHAFLKELKFVKHYENVNVIYSALTSMRAEDISHLEQQLIADFKELVTLYDSLHSKDKPEELDRKNFLNIQYLLFQLLRRHNYKCKIDDFATLKTTERKLFHDRICQKLFQQLGWNFTATF